MTPVTPAPYPPVETRPCLCGGLIGVLSRHYRRHIEEAIVAAVQEHQRTELHRAWLAAGMPGLAA